MARLASERGGLAAAGVQIPSAAPLPARLLPLAARILPWAALALSLVAGLFFRLYRLNGLITYYPDTYAQLRAVENLLAGQFPISYHYPPGVAIVLSPIFALLPTSLVTMQIAILLAGVALIAVSYLATIAATGDRRASLFFAIAVALGGTFVFHSRVGWFDVINTLLIASAIFLAPVVPRRGGVVLLAYGLLVFAAITVRHTNLVILPALFLASLEPGSGTLSLRVMVHQLRSRATIVVGSVVATLYILYLATAAESIGRFTNPNSGSILDLSGYLGRAGQYARASLLGYAEAWGTLDRIAAIAVLMLAVIGARRLWLAKPGLLLALGYLLAVWIPLHASYAIFDNRYAMPAFFFVLMLAAIGLSTTIQELPRLARPWQRVGLTALLALSIALFVGRQLANDIAYVQQWPLEVTQNREQAYDEIRAALASVDGRGSLLISSQTLAVDRANPEMETFDLIRHSGAYGINDDSIRRLLTRVRTELEGGTAVYYHYTEYEDVSSRFQRYDLGFDAYFGALNERYSMRELASDVERPQALYLIEPSASD